MPVSLVIVHALCYFFETVGAHKKGGIMENNMDHRLGAGGQITTAAALAEVQNMRDNSPTGGAVGQLTDSEREAIGLAATSLANSSSEGEYLRAAKLYRKVMIDTAFGEGTREIDSSGNVLLSAGGEASPAPTGGTRTRYDAEGNRIQ